MQSFDSEEEEGDTIGSRDGEEAGNDDIGSHDHLRDDSAILGKKRPGTLRKAPQAPKRFKSSYILFFMAKQQEIKNSIGSNAGVSQFRVYQFEFSLYPSFLIYFNFTT